VRVFVRPHVAATLRHKRLRLAVFVASATHPIATPTINVKATVANLLPAAAHVDASPIRVDDTGVIVVEAPLAMVVEEFRGEVEVLAAAGEVDEELPGPAAVLLLVAILLPAVVVEDSPAVVEASPPAADVVEEVLSGAVVLLLAVMVVDSLTVVEAVVAEVVVQVTPLPMEKTLAHAPVP